MLPEANTRDPGSVLRACTRAWEIITGREDADRLLQAFDWVRQAFEGAHPDFEPLDTKYHDLEHTLQGTLCLARLLTGWHLAGGQPPLDERAVRLGLVAILFHDTGYLKARGDHAGTGAKFTPVHVQRSAEFAHEVLWREKFPAADIVEIQSMIRCTGVNADVHALQFERPVDRRVGCALASADLLGQMAADDYIGKLPLLFEEFAEAAVFNPDVTSMQIFRSADDLIRRTPAFWDRHVRVRLERDFEGVHHYLNDPWPHGPNEYVLRVEANIARIRSLSPVIR